jgi:hypothetical protein
MTDVRGVIEEAWKVAGSLDPVAGGVDGASLRTLVADAGLRDEAEHGGEAVLVRRPVDVM